MEGIITLENMPNEYVQLKDEFLYKIIDEIRKICSFTKVSRGIKISLGKLLKFHSNKNRRKNILLSDLKKLCRFLVDNERNEYSLKNLYSQIQSIGKHRGIIEPKLPVNFTSKYGASIIADILTDGFLVSKYRIGYTNIDPLQIIDNMKSMNMLFCNYEIPIQEIELSQLQNKKITLKILKQIAKRSKVKCRIYKVKEKPNPGYSIRYYACVGKILESIGIPKGDKTETNPEIPSFLFDCENSIIFKFLERILINEGQILRTRMSISQVIDVTEKIPTDLKKIYISNPRKLDKILKKLIENSGFLSNLIRGYNLLFQKVECKSSIPKAQRIYLNHKKIHVVWRINLTGRDLDILRKNCDLNSSKKWIKLKEREDILIMLPIEERIDQVMKFAYKQKFFCSNDIAIFLNVSQSSAVHYLRKLVKLEKLIIEGYGPNTTYRLSPEVL